VHQGMGLSNILDDFQVLKKLMNSHNWKSIL